MGYNVMDSKATAEGEIPLSDFFRVFFHSAEMIGTIAFAASGAFLAIDREMDLFGVIFLGVITAVVGGILRDVLGGITPAVLRKRIYAVASLMGAWLYYELTRLNVDGSASVLAGMGLTLVIRMLAAHYQWRLPKVPHP